MPVSNKINLSSIRMPTDEFTSNNVYENGEYDLSFDAHMSSIKGSTHRTNFDNYYMNGLCSKAFKFINEERAYEDVIGKCGVFAVSCGISSDAASKLLMRALDEKKEWLMTSNSVRRLKQRLGETLSYCNRRLIEAGKLDGKVYEAAIAVAVYIKDCLVYAVCGDAALVRIHNRRVKALPSCCGNLGVVPHINPYIGKCGFGAADKAVLMSKGVFEMSSPEEECLVVIDKQNPLDIVYGIIKNISYDNPLDSTCMAVCAKPIRGIHTKTVIIAAACLLWTLLNILFIILQE